MTQISNLVKLLRLCHNDQYMAQICFYDIEESEKNHFSGLPDVHDIKFTEQSLTNENIESDVEILSIFVSSTVDISSIEKMPKLKLIACRSTGFSNIDLVACSERGIAVVNVPTYGEHTVAEYTFALMLALSKKIITSAQQMLLGSIDHSVLHGIDLQGKTLGIVGVGRIGINVSMLAEAFGMKVIAYDPFAKPEISHKGKIEMVELHNLAAKADIITLHAPLTKDNTHMIDQILLSKMKKGVFIINTARGELIETNALISALKSGKIAGAGLDVLEDEKLMDFHEEALLLKKSKVGKETLEHVLANSILMQFPNVILTSHNAYNTTEAILRINKTTVDNIKHYLAGEVRNKVNL